MSNPQGHDGDRTVATGGSSAEGGAPLGQLFAQAQRMQAALLTAQEELAASRVDGTAGGGLVRATVNGGGELVDLTISPEAVDPEDTETLADLVLAAVRDATTNAHRLAAERMGSLTGGLGGPAGVGGAGGVGRLAGLGGGGGGPAAPGGIEDLFAAASGGLGDLLSGRGLGDLLAGGGTSRPDGPDSGDDGPDSRDDGPDSRDDGPDSRDGGPGRGKRG